MRYTSRYNLAIMLAAAMVLTGCASTSQDPLTGGYASCTIPVTRNAGMGTTQPSCTAWTFGPTRTQTAAFNRRPVQ